ncbi:MAG: glycosyltransferase [Marinicellaceae bacterium]
MSNLIPYFNQVLIISPEPWDGHFVSKHHYAVTLSKTGSHVYFLSPPDNSLSDLLVKKTKYTNLWEIKSPKLTKGLRFYPSFIRRMIENKWLKSLEQKIGSKFTTIWLFENSRFYNMGFANNRLKIYHQVDLNQNFHEITASKTADIVFCTSDIIKNVLKAHCRYIYKIHHAVANFDVSKLANMYKDMITKDIINAAYIGNLRMGYLDVELLLNVVKSFPHVIFHFVGTCNKDEPLYLACTGLDNVKWWGRVDSSDIPSILNSVDVLLLTYQTAHYKDQSSPHKVMEYLASGKVTVATYTDEYKDKSELLEMVDKNSEYLSKFDTVINDLVNYNSTEKQKIRKTFANEHTYEKQLSKIVFHLKTNNLIN